MTPHFFSRGRMPEYHDARLLLKMAPQAVRPLAAIRNAVANPAGAVAAAVGSKALSAFSRFERSGLIIRAIPLSRGLGLSPGEIGPGRALATLAAAMDTPTAPGASAGVTMLELSRDANVEELRAAMAADPNVEFVCRVPVRYLCVKKAPRRPRRARVSGAAPAAAAPAPAAMWNLPMIRWNEARALPQFADASGIKVAVLDTGIDIGHPDLQGKVAKYVYDHPLLANASGPKDLIGHGTHVSGTIAASINNRIGINGICSCKIYSWKIFDDEPDYNEADDYYHYYVDPTMYQRALTECVEQGVHVVNLSIGGTGAPDPNERSLFEKLLNAGTTVVAAMGNERGRGSPTSYPAAIPGVIAVGATRITDSVTSFSNRGSHISLCAPGETIWSTLPTYGGQTGYTPRHLPGGTHVTGAPDARDTDYAAWDGTSMASPHVAAAAALLLAKSPGFTPGEVRDKLMQTADRVPGMGNEPHHPDYGAGRLNLLSLLS
jgi:subtilisin family serine protease